MDRLKSRRFRQVYAIFIIVSVFMIELNLNPLSMLFSRRYSSPSFFRAYCTSPVLLTGNSRIMREEYVNGRCQTVAGYFIGILGTAMVLASLL